MKLTEYDRETLRGLPPISGTPAPALTLQHLRSCRRLVRKGLACEAEGKTFCKSFDGHSLTDVWRRDGDCE